MEKLNINQATADQLMTCLSRFGLKAARAAAIVDYRERNGPFRSLNDLTRVGGMSRPLLDSIRASVKVEEEGVSPRELRANRRNGKRQNSKQDEDLQHSLDTEDVQKVPLGVKRPLDSPPPETISSPKRVCTTGEVGLSHLKRRAHRPSMSASLSNLDQWLGIFELWTGEERRSALDELVDRCDASLQRHLLGIVEPQFQRDFISLLPKELAFIVLANLEPKDLLRAAQTCRYWKSLCDDNLLWREKCRDCSIDDSIMKGSRKRVRVKSWKQVYLTKHRIEWNWKHGTLRLPKVLKGHDDHVITCLKFHGNRIVSGSDDNTLKVWSSTSGKHLRTLTGHTGGVWCAQFNGSTIVSGSTDRTLKVWNSDTGLCLHTLYGHTSTVRCMAMSGNKVISGSRDATLRVWDITTGQCTHILFGHLAAVRCVQYDGHKVVSGSYDYMVKVWDPETAICLHTLQGHTNRVYSLQFDGIHIVSGSLDTTIRVWHAESGQCLHTLVGHQSLTSGMELRKNILVSGNADSTIKVWDISSGHCLHTLQGQDKHQSAVTSLQFNEKFAITSSDDGTVKLWDIRTGDFIRNLVTLGSGGSGGVVWRVQCNEKKLVCAVGSRNGTEDTKLLVLDFDAP